MRETSVAYKRCEELLDLSVKALELAIEIKGEQGDQMGISAKLVTEDKPFPLMPTRSSWTNLIH